MKKIMVLGAIYAQVPLIEAAKRLGYHAVAASIPGDYPGFAAADECCYVDITDPEAVAEEASRLQVDGVTTCGMDTGIVAMGRACDKLGLCGISQQAAAAASNKYMSKKAFVEAGVRCADYRVVKNEADLESVLDSLGLPAAVKAVDLMGSRGIYRCNTREEAHAAFVKVMEETRQEYCLVEEFIDGLLFGADGMFSEGKLVFLLPFGTEAYMGGQVATPVGHWAPFEYQDMLEEIRALVTKAGNALGIQNGPFNCDLMLRDGRVYLIEINGRPGATCIPEIISNYYGCNYYEVICRQAAGEDVSGFFRLDGRVPFASISHIIGSDRNGILREIRNNNEMADDICDLTFGVKTGERVSRYQNGRDRLGQVIIKGSTLEECRRRMAEVMDNIELVIDGGSESLGD